MLIRLIMLKIIFTHSVTCFPSVVIKTGIQKSQDGQQHNANNHEVAFKLGTAGSESESGHNKGNENNHAYAEDTGKFSEENGDKKQHLDESNFANENFHQSKGGSVADFGNNIAHKKGNHKSGFHNTYHKDEHGSNSSYYDDNDDHGGEYVHNSRQGTYGDAGSRNDHGSHLDGNYYSKENANRGGYNKGGSYNRDLGDNRDYNQENYYNNHENKGDANEGNQYGSSKGYFEKEYHQHPQYYERQHYYHQPRYYEQPHYYEKPYYYENSGYTNDYYEPYNSYNYPEKKVITIYEDPRVLESSSEQRRYEKFPQYETNYDNDLVQLDIRPTPLRPQSEYYQAGKPIYEDYSY